MESIGRRRMILLGALLVAMASGIGVRLWQLQVLDSDRLAHRARSQHEKQITVLPPRGLIVDRLGRELAVSLETRSLFAHPGRLEDPTRAAALLAPHLGMRPSELLARLRSEKPFVWLKRFLEPEQVERIRGLELPLGDDQPLGFLVEPRRYYPRGALAVHVVGYATIDGEGVEGIEREFDDELRGGPRVYMVTQDAKQGRLSRLVSGADKAPHDVALTLDVVLQHLVERELDRGMRETRAAAASAILLDPRTGQVLALANRPAADPNQYGRSKPSARVNRAIVHQYEPGSTFKAVAMAAALERDRVRPEQIFDCGAGQIRLGSRVIRDAKPHQLLTASEILHRSSNVGMVKIAQRLTSNELRETIERFGFGRPTGIELPGEVGGRLRDSSDWTATSYASLSFGHEIGVTTLQMAAALATIANDGIAIPPRVVLGRRTGDGAFVQQEAPSAQRVLSARTARVLTSMLEGVVLEGGTGKRASIAGYRVAGKTGTAQKVVDGRYSTTDHVASFGGFAPTRDPRLVCLVVLDAPVGAAHQGGQTAAPIFSRILTGALRHLRVPADEEPLLVARHRAESEAAAMPAVRTAPASPVVPPHDDPNAVPDLLGLTLREAMARLNVRGLQARVEGSGVVAAQDPPPGTPLDGASICHLRLEPGEHRAPLGSRARLGAP